LPAAADVDAVAESLRRAGHAYERDADGSMLARDPWGTAVRVRAAGSSDIARPAGGQVHA
jgi:hypothetical protein